MATHSSVLAWRIPGTGEPGGLPSMGSHRVRHDWSDLAAAAAAGMWLFVVCVLSDSVISDSLMLLGREPARLLCPWNFPGKNTGGDCHFFLKGIFLTQGLNPCCFHLLHWQVDSLALVPSGYLLGRVIVLPVQWKLCLSSFFFLFLLCVYNKNQCSKISNRYYREMESIILVNISND